ncbi:hypothetical protein DTX80_08390 [Bacilli bacterium]|uniref:Uncharacterized protein n=2 Tax=Bacillales TaxID=1385 RepID=A0ABR5MJA1_9BACI|nr:MULTISPECIES: hypothetical protein [Bacillaceae]KKE78763.1 hypothetical protein WH51_11125 [Bacilli bacterium VT-13-104]PZD85045.1 hypothetical protein DEJ64_10845 [Bacilli bacterium]KPH75175.1 hypothetical protein AFL42_09135 [Oceanobacillus caeni]PZD85899.1 hypothetical protein DEJ60_11530 [Bacilli bacterium]PZD89477.1 hypothetical protein DEJ66_11485 [Bacilli bacterium]
MEVFFITFWGRLLGQLALTFVIWIAMAVFYSDMNQGSKLIFYLVTSWLLFIFVVVIKTWLTNRKENAK